MHFLVFLTLKKWVVFKIIPVNFYNILSLYLYVQTYFYVIINNNTGKLLTYNKLTSRIRLTDFTSKMPIQECTKWRKPNLFIGGIYRPSS